MENEIHHQDENNNKKNTKNQTPKNIIRPITNEKGAEKESKMMSIKNMFNLSNDNNSIKNNHFNNSFYKESNQEITHNDLISLIPRTFSNNQLNKEKHLNNKNFPSKQIFVKVI